MQSVFHRALCLRGYLSTGKHSMQEPWNVSKLKGSKTVFFTLWPSLRIIWIAQNSRQVHVQTAFSWVGLWGLTPQTCGIFFYRPMDKGVAGRGWNRYFYLFCSLDKRSECFSCRGCRHSDWIFLRNADWASTSTFTIFYRRTVNEPTGLNPVAQFAQLWTH